MRRGKAGGVMRRGSTRMISCDGFCVVVAIAIAIAIVIGVG